MKKIIPFILWLVVLAWCWKVENQNQETIQNSSSSVSNWAIISSSISFNSKNNWKTFVVPSEINIDWNKLDLMPVPQNSSNFWADEGYYYWYKKDNWAVWISSGQPSFWIEKTSNKFLWKKINNIEDFYNAELGILIWKNVSWEMFNFDSLKSDWIDKSKIFWENKNENYIEVSYLYFDSPYYAISCYFKDDKNFFRAWYMSPIDNINSSYSESEKEKYFEKVKKEWKIQSLKLKWKICNEVMKNIKNSWTVFEIPKVIKYKNQNYNFLYKAVVPELWETNWFWLSWSQNPLKDWAIIINAMWDKIWNENIKSLDDLQKKMVSKSDIQNFLSSKWDWYIEIWALDNNQFWVSCFFNKDKNYYVAIFTIENDINKNYLENYKKEKGQFCKAILESK